MNMKGPTPQVLRVNHEPLAYLEPLHTTISGSQKGLEDPPQKNCVTKTTSQQKTTSFIVLRNKTCCAVYMVFLFKLRRVRSAVAVYMA